jgi:hypothetical protein
MPRTSLGNAIVWNQATCVKEFWTNSALGRPGDDLLSHDLGRTIIGPEELNDRVRNGIGWGLFGIATRSSQRRVLDIVL